MIGLVRAESLRGRAHSRLARPAELWSVSLSAAWWVSGVVVALLTAALLALPVSQSYMGSGYVASSQASGSIIRSSTEGTVKWIAAEGERVGAGERIAEIDRGARTEAAFSAMEAARAHVSLLREAEAKDSALIKERYLLELAQIRTEQASLEARLRETKTSMRDFSEFSEAVAKLNARVNAEAPGMIAKVDTLAMAERALNARSRVAQLQSDGENVSSAIASLERRKRMAEIDRDRQLSAMRTSKAQVLAEASVMAATIGSIEVSSTEGKVATAFKKLGDWVRPGDELASVQSLNAPLGQVVMVPLPDRLGGAVAVGQSAMLWLKAGERSERPIRGQIERVDRSSSYRGVAGTAAIDSGEERRTGFVATLRIEHGQESLHVEKLAVGSEVGVEIIMGSRSVLNMLIPERIRARAEVVRGAT